MQQILKSNALPMVLAGILFVMTLNSIDQVDRWFERQMPAITWHSVEVKTPVVRPGEELALIYRATVNKTCAADLRGFIDAPDGSVPIRFPITKGGYAKPAPEPQEIPVRILIPPTSDPGLASLKSGPHAYRTNVTRYCPEGTEEDASVPSAHFMLEVPQ